MTSCSCSSSLPFICPSSVYIPFKRDLPAQALPVCSALYAPVRKVSLSVHCHGAVRMEVSEHLARVRGLAFHLAVSGGWTWVVRLGSKSLLTHELSHWPRRALLLFFSKAFCSLGLLWLWGASSGSRWSVPRGCLSSLLLPPSLSVLSPDVLLLRM